MNTLKRSIAALAAFAVLGASSPAAPGAEPLVNEAVIKAPVREVWRMFTTSDGMQSWMVARAEMDLRIGGLMRTRYAADGPLGDEKTIVNRVLSFEPERMLSIQVDRPPADFRWKKAVASMWTVVHFQPVSDTTTSVRIVAMGFDDTPESREMREFFAQGNAWTLEQLRKKFAGP